MFFHFVGHLRAMVHFTLLNSEIRDAHPSVTKDINGVREVMVMVRQGRIKDSL